MNAVLALEDGTWYRGVAAGALGEARGEVVFNTSMSGYQEILTDPSYAGQIVTMTAPQIGNYGVAAGDVESQAPAVAGFIMREASPVASNWRADSSLRDYLVCHNIVAIADIDTRALTRVLRSAGVMRGIIATGQTDPQDLVEKARAIPQMEGSDLVKDVTCGSAFEWRERASRFGEADHQEFGIVPARCASKPVRIAAYDYGIKYNILRRLSAYGCDVKVFPAAAPANDLLATKPDGVFLSNGPGDPAVLSYAIDNVRELLKADVPMFGICLGHQILGLAYGATTYKLKFGHRGANHPVKALDTGKVEITSQNHGFAVDPSSLPPDVKPTHVNLYDGTLEGFRHVSRPVFSVQYHPEASPGPHDADYLFCEFLDSIEKR
jgi:carbamoyl-phosphate synthase small subunit